jgi:hypothetical protein
VDTLRRTIESLAHQRGASPTDIERDVFAALPRDALAAWNRLRPKLTLSLNDDRAYSTLCTNRCRATLYDRYGRYDRELIHVRAVPGVATQRAALIASDVGNGSR